MLVSDCLTGGSRSDDRDRGGAGGIYSACWTFGCVRGVSYLGLCQWPENADVGQKNQFRYGVIAAAVGVVLAVLVALFATLWLLGVDLFALSVRKGPNPAR